MNKQERNLIEYLETKTTPDQSSSQVQPEHSQHATLHLLGIAFDAGKLFEEFLVQAPETAQGSLRHLSLHLRIHPDLRSKFAVILDRLENRARKPERSASQSGPLSAPADAKDEPEYSDRAVLLLERQLQTARIGQESPHIKEPSRNLSTQKGTHDYEGD